MLALKSPATASLHRARNVGWHGNRIFFPHGDPAKALFGKLVVLAVARILRMAWLSWRQLDGQATASFPAQRMAVPARRSDAAWTPGRVCEGASSSQAHAAAVVTEAAAVWRGMWLRVWTSEC